MHAPTLQEIRKIAEVIQSQLKELGLDITLNVECTDTFYNQWCKVYDSKNEPAGCDGGQEFGLRRLRQPGNTRRVPGQGLLDRRVELGPLQQQRFQRCRCRVPGRARHGGRATAIKKIQTIATEEVPYAIPYFVNSLTAYSKKVTGIVQTGLGHYYLGKAGFVA